MFLIVIVSVDLVYVSCMTICSRKQMSRKETVTLLEAFKKEKHFWNFSASTLLEEYTFLTTLLREASYVSNSSRKLM